MINQMNNFRYPIRVICCGFLILMVAAACQKKSGLKPCCTTSAVINQSNLNLPNESIYQLESKWQDQDNKTLTLNSLSGKIQIVAMIFTNCKLACPRLIVDLKLIESKLSAEQKKKSSFLLISFDSERDTPKSLKKFAVEMQLDENWKLIHSTEKNIREISMILDVSYEKQTDGTFSHSNAIHIINETGIIVHRQEGLGSDNTQTLAAISNILAALQIHK